MDSLKIFCPIMRTFLSSGGGGGTIEAFHSVRGVFFVCVLEESP